MLDLNLNCLPSSWFHDPADSKHSSNSSVVNVDTSSHAGDEEHSNQPYHEHCFGILKPGGEQGDEHGESYSQGSVVKPRFTTKELFPVAGAPRLMDPLVQQQGQQVKKSRRGPRSKSSQYRGVTFYRRTGRWESHIWSAYCCCNF